MSSVTLDVSPGTITLGISKKYNTREGVEREMVAWKQQDWIPDRVFQQTQQGWRLLMPHAPMHFCKSDTHTRTHVPCLAVAHSFWALLAAQYADVEKYPSGVQLFIAGAGFA